VDPARLRRYAGPAAFLLAATIAVVLIRSGLEAGEGPRQATPPAGPASGTHASTTTTTTTKTTKTTKAAPHTQRYWVVRAGDTFAVISAKSGVPVSTIARLNPAVHSTSLFIGQKIRLK
jgi:LysM repeat protein